MRKDTDEKNHNVPLAQGKNFIKATAARSDSTERISPMLKLLMKAPVALFYRLVH